ncbi:MAG: CAP domain-containing protein [Lutibacter sp.]|uniref:CAP domain-containing protein n=1 Tax=Lutibacter sp. TaxID=1925666 RepID=UPI0017E00852|nr:CAP domain-containing protein [Lutibacter sp.]MBT8316492.1 CAP domain-containing protein [Lutibacter sp.]NNJ57352.1 CAP domain-containing protein [Lutibacter sp.]
MKVFILLFVVAILISVASCSQDNEEIYMTQIIDHKNTYSSMELEILNLVNNYRDSLGINRLSKLDIVSTVAFSHTTYMAEVGKVSHDNFYDRHQELVNLANAKTVGENVGYGYNSANGVFNAWILSDSHKQLIENSKFTHFGISTEKNSKGRNYFTQIFITK